MSNRVDTGQKSAAAAKFWGDVGSAVANGCSCILSGAHGR